MYIHTYIHILSSSSNYRAGAQGGSGDGGSPDLSMDAQSDSELSQLAHRMACMGFSSSQAFLFFQSHLAIYAHALTCTHTRSQTTNYKDFSSAQKDLSLSHTTHTHT
jgi:hypothetical protein